MEQHLARAATFLSGAFNFLIKGARELWAWAVSHKKISIPSAIVLVAALIGLSFLLGNAAKPPEADERREVTLVSVADVSSGEPITVIGEIKSVSEATVSPDSSGRVTRVYRQIGDYVAAGAAIAEIENASQRAAVAQAQASFDKAKSGSTLSGISVEGATAAGESARQSAYAALYDAVTRKADSSFSNAESAQPVFFVSISNSNLKNTLEQERLAISAILKRHTAARAATLEDAALISELETLAEETEKIREFLSTLTTALSGAIATASVSETQIATYQADASAALSTVASLRGTLSSAALAIESAKESQSQGRTGESADVALAQAALDAARAALEKTIIRAPISGTINSISLEQGNFAAAGTPSVRIVNVSGLEAVAYLSERDLPRVSVGSFARISGVADGRVSRLAPALDPGTRKAEVRIAILGSASENRFVAGQSATIELTPRRSQGDTAIFIPISGVKITPDGAVVLIVIPNEENPAEGTLASLPVTIGALSGGKVEITSGLTLDNAIVLDARGLKDGQEVLISGR